MSTRQKRLVTVVIPCFNEADNIEQVIQGFTASELVKEAFDFDILVIDNNSIDGTAEIAAQTGARVIREYQQGKGYAMRTGFRNIHPNASYVVMLDGDDTYRPDEALRLIEPLHHNFCDVVIGSRLGGKMYDKSMKIGNRGFNWLCVHIVRIFYRANVTDVLSGYYAWRRDVIEELVPYLCASGFSLEMEMVTKMARMNFDVYSVPISYHKRLAGAGIRAVDSIPILKMFAMNLLWRPTIITPNSASEELVTPNQTSL